MTASVESHTRASQLHTGARSGCLISRLASLIGVVGISLSLIPAAASAQIPKTQQKCINGLNKNFAAVAKAQGKDICKCIKGGAQGKLAPLNIEQCTTADTDGKVEKAKGKTISKEFPDCAPAPPFGATDSATVNQVAVDKELLLIHEIFGSDLDTAIILKADNPDGHKCQIDIAKATKKCQDTKLKEFNSCKKNALKGKNGDPVESGPDLQQRCLEDPTSGRIPDPKGKIQSTCGTKLDARISKSCSGVDQATAFAGACFNAPDLGVCLDRLVECQVCLGLNIADGLVRNCDLFDDGSVNQSCVASCGNAIIEFSEECDDGNVSDGDGCSSSCQAELPFTIRIVDHNILQDISTGNIGFDDLADRLTLLAEQIAIIDPDIVTLQEVTLGFFGGPTALVDDLQSRFGLEYFAAEYGVATGNAVLSKWPLSLEEVVRIPSEETVPSFPDRRFAARVVAASPIGPLDVYAMHFCAGSVGTGCTMPNRTVQTGEFIEFFEATHVSAHPAIIGADFNAHTGTAPDADPNNDAPIDLMQAAGWFSLFDGFDAPCDSPTDRSGCTSGIRDLTMTADTTRRRIDNIMIAPASQLAPIPPISEAIELGPTLRFADVPFTDPNPECHFDPRLPCDSDGDCPSGTECNPNDFCVRQSPIACTTDLNCPDDIAPESCRTTLWISDHVGVESTIEIRRLP